MAAKATETFICPGVHHRGVLGLMERCMSDALVPGPEAELAVSGTLETPASQNPDLPPYERYNAVLGALLAEATKHKTFSSLVPVLTRVLAIIAVQCGPVATGEIIAELGRSIRLVSEQCRAEAEAAQQREKGELPH